MDDIIEWLDKDNNRKRAIYFCPMHTENRWEGGASVDGKRTTVFTSLGWGIHLCPDAPRTSQPATTLRHPPEGTLGRNVWQINRFVLLPVGISRLGGLTLPFPRVISNFSHSPTTNITSHSMKNLAFHPFLGWNIIILPILNTSLVHFSWKRLGEYFFGSERVNSDQWEVDSGQRIYLRLEMVIAFSFSGGEWGMWTAFPGPHAL